MFPTTKKKVVDTSTSIAKEKICLCKTLTPLISLCRIVGFLPITWKHIDGKCVYKRSLFWMLYSILLICVIIFQLVYSVDFLNLTKVKSLPIMMNDITEAIYGTFIVILLMIFFYKTNLWVKSLNRLQKVLRHNIFCQSSMRQCLTFQRGLTGMLMLLFGVVTTTLLYLDLSKNSRLGINFFINKILCNQPFHLYALFIGLMSTFLGIFACFEKLLITYLRYRPVHPMKGIDETNNRGDFFGVIQYDLCKGLHQGSDHMKKLDNAEIIEFLRILHEEISTVIYSINDCLNPQLLCHTVVELAVLVIYWYAVIVYVAYDFQHPLAPTIHAMNCLFVILHTLGLFFFMKYAQRLKNMVNGLTGLLLEYSTRISSTEEHQQVRMFIEKLQQHRPISASGVFDVDLGIAGPISANILTYVLVALQFEIPKEENK